MKLTWRDAVTTLIAAGIVGIVWAAFQEWTVATWGNHRLAVLIVGLLGVAMCIIGATVVITTASPYTTLMGVLAALVGIAMVLGLIFGTRILLVATAAAILVMWMISTVRHIFA